MIALWSWAAYLAIALVIVPTVWRTRYGRWPFVLRRPSDVYTRIEWAYAAVLCVFTIGLWFEPPIEPLSVPAGLTLLLLGIAIQLWGIRALEANWRIGFDPRDATHRYVTRGPYRAFRHPIYVSLVLVAIGQSALVGLDWRSALLVGATVVYVAVQGRAETRYWRSSVQSSTS